MNEKQFYELIESIDSLSKIDWTTIIISIVGVLISGLIAFIIAKYQVDKSEEQFQKQIDENRQLEKEMYFRKTKIENIKATIQKLEDIEEFYNNQLIKLTSLYYNEISLDELIKYHDLISEQYYNNFVKFSEGIINIPFNNCEKEILDRLNLKTLNINFLNAVKDTSSKLKIIYASWNLNPKHKTENDNRVESAKEVITKLKRLKLKTNIILNFLFELNLSEMNDIGSKKIDSETFMLKLNEELKKNKFEEL
ncbi:MAG: hypothetical protein ACLVEW_02660 [Peptoniphilus sp.]|uniref:hypothetical protein n=1 Tax=Peptoniphilus sp. TaxID=1971214 RepID=UPI00399AD83F